MSSLLRAAVVAFCFLLLSIGITDAFTSAGEVRLHHSSLCKRQEGITSIRTSRSQLLRANPDPDLSEEIRVKLKAEIATPFGRFRQFVLASLGAAAGLGSASAIPQLIIALTKPDPAIPLDIAIQNAAIDVAGVIGSIFLLSRELSSERERVDKFTDKEKKQTFQLTSDEVLEREKFFSMLPVEIQVSEKDENATRVVAVSALQGKGKQNVVVVAGLKSFVNDAIISARLEGSELFFKKETFVIPVILSESSSSGSSSREIKESGLDPNAALLGPQKESKRGFGAQKDELLTAPYFGRPTQLDVWETYLRREIELAESQGTKNPVETGLVIAVRSNGKVLRRGVGLPPWKQIVDELSQNS